ncbi:MAG: creatininase family protein [Spirochaetota bacterium]
MQPNHPRPYILRETTYRRLLELEPKVAVLPWGATEAHGHHLPYATDVLQAEAFASRAAEIAVEKGGRPVVLPAVPFGNNAQQLDQAATVHLSSATAFSVLRDVARSMTSQGIDRLLIVNSHGGNEFRPAVRDLELETGVLIVVADFFRMLPDLRARLFSAPGDHADEMETSLMLHLAPHLVDMGAAGSGERRRFEIAGLEQPGVWSPRPWSAVHPDTGSGDPRGATADRGREFFEAVSGAIADVIVGLSEAQPGDLPYLFVPGR